MDEAFFTRNGILNTRNQHTWADENPYSFQETRFRHQFAINVWAGIIGDLLRGPYDLPPRLSGSSSLQFLLTITATTGGLTIGNVADNVGTA
jgi:hypothetical protein